MNRSNRSCAFSLLDPHFVIDFSIGRSVKSSNTRIQFLIAVAGIFLSVPCLAAVPETVTIQGTLEAAGGGPLGGSHEYRIRFYDQEGQSGGNTGTLLASVTGTAELSSSGRFAISVPFAPTILEATEAWYELAIDAAGDGIGPDDVFPDRVQVHSVPFALLSNESQTLDGHAPEDFATDAELTSGLATKADATHTHSDQETKVALVYGESTVSLSHAAGQANVAMQGARALGYRPISVGGGVGVGYFEGVASVYTVLIVLEGPETAPDLALGSGAPLNADSDGDGIPDGVEFAHGLDAGDPNDATGDLDLDLFTNLQEFQAGTNMLNPDTDGDGFDDSQDSQPLNPLVH